MSLITLLAVVVGMLVLSEFMDIFPGVLWGWIHWPSWLSWALVVSFLVWCSGDPN